MTPFLSALPSLLLQAATLSPSTVPATGRFETVLTLDAPGAVHLSARSASGTSCELIDRVRGPFASSGSAGTSNCELDLLLDAGQYKVRLDSSKKGKGQVQLSATPFVELNPTPVRLAPGTGVLTALKPGQQASYWLSVTTRQVPFVRVAGRHAGEVRLWRNGEWLEPQTMRHSQNSPLAGQPQHEWWLDSVLEPGEYLLVAYGRDSTKIAGASVDDSLTVESGFPQAGPSVTSVAFTLPASGVTTVRVPSQYLAAVVGLDAPPAGPVTLGVHDVRGETSGLGSASTCRIEKASLTPECSATGGTNNPTPGFEVIIVRGPPGTRGLLEWAPYRSDSSAWLGNGGGGYYGSPAGRIDFQVGTSGHYLTGIHDLPLDVDSAPQGCQLERMNRDWSETTGIVARQVTRIGDGEHLEKAFNYDGNGAIVWFEVGAATGGKGLLEKTGLSSRKYRVEAQGGLKSHCEIFRLEGKGTLNRLTESKPDDKACNQVTALTPGVYQVQLYDGVYGAEKLVIKEDGAKGTTLAPAQVGCLFPDVNLEAGNYRLTLARRDSAVATRGFMLRPLPLLTSTTAHLVLEGKGSLSLPLAASGPLDVRSSGGGMFGCALTRTSVGTTAGVCSLPAVSVGEVLTLTNPTAAPMQLTLGHAGTAPVLGPLSVWTPKLTPLTRILPDSAMPYDFDRNQSQAVSFDVATPGLYNVTTLGLLGTECRLRTPVVEQVASNSGGGRGRNCLVQTYLQKGRYLLTVRTVGSSKGRGSIFLTRRPPREFASVVGEGQAFFRVDANELVQQKITIRTAGGYTLGTAGQGQTLNCRIEDAEGWPLERVPVPCKLSRELQAGTYLWTQLPLTVESMRRTKLEKHRDALVLRGNRPHALEYFTWYDAELGPDGKDEFLFKLEGETDLDVVLTGGMQGRVYLVEDGKLPRPVEVIPPQGVAAPQQEEQAPQEQGQEEQARPSYADNPDQGSCEGEGCPEQGYQQQEQQQTQAAQPMEAQAAPPPPSGARLHLAAGSYKIIAEHSRGDVNISYRLHLGSALLLPGMGREVPVPSTVDLSVPRNGTLRIKTVGDADVRCRLFDATGRLVLEGSENGADWNCAIAEPVQQGRYRLVVESETQAAGTTTLSLALPPSDEKGPVTDAAKLALGAPVVTLKVPVPATDAVQELGFTAKTPFSCALEDPTGTVAARRLRVTDCGLLVRPSGEGWKVRLWTTDGAANVVSALRTRPVKAGSGKLEAGQAMTVQVEKAGRWATDARAFCLPDAERGLLLPCGPEVSLEKGPVLFATFGPDSMSLPMDEVKVPSSDAAVAMELSKTPHVQTVTGDSDSVFLMSATVGHGERAAPACRFDGAGTAKETRGSGCFAASHMGKDAVGRLWAPTTGSMPTQVTRRSVRVPSRADALTPGRVRLAFKDGVGLFALPSGRARVELTVPRDGWAVQLGDDGSALDLCAPQGELRQCVFNGQGGKVLLVAPANAAEASTVLLEGAPVSAVFAGLYEDSPRQAGSVRLTVAAQDTERTLSVVGAQRCLLLLAGGERVGDCRATLPAKVASELLLDYGVQPFRAVAWVKGKERQAVLGFEPPSAAGPGLAPSVSVPLQNGRADRALMLDKESVVRIKADSGVCALYKGNELVAVDGLESGCEVVRLLAPGAWRVVVRPFAGRALPGSLTWTAEAMSVLGEGVGAEAWLAPGAVRLFRFDTKAKGRVGLGLQARSEVLECLVSDAAFNTVGEGCHQYLALDKGSYFLLVRNPARPGAVPLALKPVVLGLAGDTQQIPDEYLKEFFQRVEVTP